MPLLSAWPVSGSVTVETGYDTALPQGAGLYRMAMAIALERARRLKRQVNMSGGAASFKRNRGAIPAIEYTAVHDRGLPLANRLASQMVRGVLERVGVPLMRRGGL